MSSWYQNEDEEQVFDPTASLRLVNQLFAKETMETMINKDFYAMEFNISCRTRSNVFVPIEVGIVKFSIKDGIKDSYHDFIHPGRVPLGYAATAKDLYLNYHGIPVHGFTVKNYNLFLENSQKSSRADDTEDYHTAIKEAIKRIDEFVKPDVVYREAERGRPGLDVRPVFSYPTEEAGVVQTDGCLRRLASESKNLSFYEGFQVMDVVHMVKFACRLKSESADRAYAIFKDNFNKKILLPPADECCEYHKDIGTFNCARNLAYTVAYCFLDFVCPNYPVKITPAHLPPPIGEPEFW